MVLSEATTSVLLLLRLVKHVEMIVTQEVAAYEDVWRLVGNFWQLLLPLWAEATTRFDSWQPCLGDPSSEI